LATGDQSQIGVVQQIGGVGTVVNTTVQPAQQPRAVILVETMQAGGGNGHSGGRSRTGLVIK
jgi:hypothetical protein